MVGIYRTSICVAPVLVGRRKRRRLVQSLNISGIFKRIQLSWV